MISPRFKMKFWSCLFCGLWLLISCKVPKDSSQLSSLNPTRKMPFTEDGRRIWASITFLGADLDQKYKSGQMSDVDLARFKSAIKRFIELNPVQYEGADVAVYHEGRLLLWQHSIKLIEKLSLSKFKAWQSEGQQESGWQDQIREIYGMANEYSRPECRKERPDWCIDYLKTVTSIGFANPKFVLHVMQELAGQWANLSRPGSWIQNFKDATFGFRDSYLNYWATSQEIIVSFYGQLSSVSGQPPSFAESGITPASLPGIIQGLDFNTKAIKSLIDGLRFDQEVEFLSSNDPKDFLVQMNQLLFDNSSDDLDNTFLILRTLWKNIYGSRFELEEDSPETLDLLMSGVYASTTYYMSELEQTYQILKAIELYSHRVLRPDQLNVFHSNGLSPNQIIFNQWVPRVVEAVQKRDINGEVLIRILQIFSAHELTLDTASPYLSLIASLAKINLVHAKALIEATSENVSAEEKQASLKEAEAEESLLLQEAKALENLNRFHMDKVQQFFLDFGLNFADFQRALRFQHQISSRIKDGNSTLSFAVGDDNKNFSWLNLTEKYRDISAQITQIMANTEDLKVLDSHEAYNALKKEGLALGLQMACIVLSLPTEEGAQLLLSDQSSMNRLRTPTQISLLDPYSGSKLDPKEVCTGRDHVFFHSNVRTFVHQFAQDKVFRKHAETAFALGSTLLILGIAPVAGLVVKNAILPTVSKVVQSRMVAHPVKTAVDKAKDVTQRYMSAVAARNTAAAFQYFNQTFMVFGRNFDSMLTMGITMSLISGISVVGISSIRQNADISDGLWDAMRSGFWMGTIFGLLMHPMMLTFASVERHVGSTTKGYDLLTAIMNRSSGLAYTDYNKFVRLLSLLNLKFMVVGAPLEGLIFANIPLAQEILEHVTAFVINKTPFHWEFILDKFKQENNIAFLFFEEFITGAAFRAVDMYSLNKMAREIPLNRGTRNSGFRGGSQRNQGDNLSASEKKFFDIYGLKPKDLIKNRLASGTQDQKTAFKGLLQALHTDKISDLDEASFYQKIRENFDSGTVKRLEIHLNKMPIKDLSSAKNELITILNRAYEFYK